MHIEPIKHIIPNSESSNGTTLEEEHIHKSDALDQKLENSLESMSTSSTMSVTSVKPIQTNERIEILDVIRGFALIGIFLMNIEFFNRSTQEVGEGLAHGLTGIDWWASFFVQYFITGKFWTMFSMLFGMGFAVMLTRAQDKGSEFLKPYLRRVAALAVFGILHNILLWPGDILLSYAATASMLLLILFAPAWAYVLGMALFGLFAVIPGMENFASFAVVFGLAGWIALYLRCEQGIVHGIYAVAACFALLISIGMAIFSDGKIIALMVLLIALFGFLLSYLLMRFHRNAKLRPLAFGLIYYFSIFIVGVAATAYDYANVERSKAAIYSTSIQTQLSTLNSAEGKTAGSLMDEVNDRASAQSKREKLEQERKQEYAKQQKKTEEELRTVRNGSYGDLVKLRIRELSQGFGGNIIMSCLAIALFLIGFGLMRLGIIENSKAYLPQFRLIAIIGIPLGLGIDLFSAYFAIEYFPGVNDEAFYLAMSMQMLSYLPTCLGYVSVLICLMHSPLAKFLSNLAPYGRMALTNYLGQSLIASSIFYGYGLGWFGMGRAKQIVFVLFVVICQIAFSHWWLARFRYGPMEWVWRAITYWTWPKNFIGASGRV
jgi:uncharacterized membrane protein YeiB